MSWQDIVLMVGGFFFAVSLIPAVISSNKPPVATSLPTGMVLIIFVIVYTTLHLWLAALSVGLTGLIWLILAFQMMFRRRT